MTNSTMSMGAKPRRTCISCSKSQVCISTTTFILLFILTTSTYTHINAESNSSPSKAPTPSIPRSTNARSILHSYDDYDDDDAHPDQQSSSDTDTHNPSQSSSTTRTCSAPQLPPWNQSPNIDAHGFLTELYTRIPGEWELESHIGGRHQYIDREEPVIIRQVPGDGNCLFHSITVSMAAIVNGTHLDMTVGGNTNHQSRRIHCDVKSNGETQSDGDKRQLRWGSRVAQLYENDDERDEEYLLDRTEDDSAYEMESMEDEDSEVYLYDQGDEENESDHLSNQHYELSTYGSAITRQKSKHSKGMSTPSQPYVHDIRHLHHHSKLLRHQAVDMLSSNPRKLLFLQGNEYLRARDLVNAAAAQYDLTGEEYCELMRKDSYWGGGPEIVALCNLLKRPIHVYELASCSRLGSAMDEENTQMTMMERNDDKDNNFITTSVSSSSSSHPQQFYLRRMACFGSPKFDRKEPLHILSADSRFPDISPGSQLASGNHFLALFPRDYMIAVYEAEKRRMKKLRRRRSRRHAKRKGSGVRGGAGSTETSTIDQATTCNAEDMHNGYTKNEPAVSRKDIVKNSSRDEENSLNWKKTKVCRKCRSFIRHVLEFWTLHFHSKK